MPLSLSEQPQKTRVFVETWTPAGLKVTNSAVTAMIYCRSRGGGEYFADIRRQGELIETVTAPTLPAIKAELEAHATSR